MWNLVLVCDCCSANRFISAVCNPTQIYQFSNCLKLSFYHFSACPKAAVSTTLKLEDVPHVTILRPVKGLEPYLYECLGSAFLQDYPREKLTIYICVATTKDPSLPLLQKLLSDFSDIDAKIYVEDEDKVLNTNCPETPKLGPNPKIRNLSRAYRDAKGDIVWILDCNIWVGPGVAGRMVDKLCGLKAHGDRTIPYKLVHQLPIVIDSEEFMKDDRSSLTVPTDVEPDNTSSLSYKTELRSASLQAESKFINTQKFGGRLEEMFMSSSHAKFYVAINTISVAPCIVGKSNMFRKSHLDYVTRDRVYRSGLDNFSVNICEDQLIGDALWRKKVEEEECGQKYHRHGLLYGDLAIQPMSRMSITEYIDRRVRWLRVRKWIVVLATLVEPGVEPLLCSAHGAFAFTSLPYLIKHFNLSQTWLTLILAWLFSVSAWMFLDTLSYARLQSGVSIEFNSYTPSFVLQLKCCKRRPFLQWVTAWLGRELLALPIWIRACLCGATVLWRGKRYYVEFDLTVSEAGQTNTIEDASKKVNLQSKVRRD